MESPAIVMREFSESTFADRLPMRVLHCSISPSRRASWLRRCSVSLVLSCILRCASRMSPCVRSFARFTSSAVRGAAFLAPCFWRPDVVVVRFRVEELHLAFFLDVACSVRVFLRCCAAALLSGPHNNVTERMMMYNNDRYTVVRRWG